MKILSIDTTVVAGSIALTDSGRLAAQEQQGASGTHSQRIISSIDHLLEVAGWKVGDVEGIAVALGPGSFTGLRIGISVAKGMALALGLPIAGVSSLKSLAICGAGFAGTVAPLIDARRGELFGAAWRAGHDGSMTPVLEEFAAPPGETAARLGRIEGPLMLLGDGAALYSEELAGALGSRALFARGSAAVAQAANLALLLEERLKAGGDDLAGLSPNYVRRSDAEIGFMGRNRPAGGGRVKATD